MSKQKWTALLAAFALVLGLCGASVLAAPEGEEADTSQTQEAGDSSADTSASSAADSSAAGGDALPADTGDGSQAAGTEDPGEGTEAAPEDGEEDSGEPKEEAPLPPEPDPVGTISFANLGSRMKEGNLNCLIIEENIGRITDIDYTQMEDDLRKQLNDIANQQWAMLSIPGLGQMMSASLQAQYDGYREAFDNLRDGKLQEDNEDLIWQLRTTENQAIMMGETLYITLAGLELNSSSVDRSLAALDRTVEELELRYDLGQVSALTLQETRGGRTSAVSGKQTLDVNIRNMKLQLEQLLGAELTGTIRLQALPQVTGKELDAMDLEADLAAAKEASYSLYAARQTLDDAYSDYKDAGRENGYNEKKYQFVQAQHAWQAAQYTYQNTVQTFELSFRTLYNQVKDYKQVLDAARTSLAVEKANLEATKLKYDQGTVSQNTLRTAQDDVAAAQETVDGAAIDLFSAYNTYRWAAEYGILN